MPRIAEQARRLAAVTHAAMLCAGINASALPAQQAAVERAKMAFAAIEREDWRSVAAMTDSAERARFQAKELGYLVSWAEVVGQSGPVVGYALDDSVDADRLERVKGTVINAFPGRPTLDSLRRLTSQDFLARFLATIHHGWVESGADHVARPVRRRIVGGVVDGDTLVHVVYYRDGDNPDRNSLNLALLSLRFAHDEWWLLLNRDLEDSYRLITLLSRARH